MATSPPPIGDGVGCCSEQSFQLGEDLLDRPYILAPLLGGMKRPI